MKYSDILKAQRASKQAELEGVLDAPTAEKRGLNEDERTKFDELRKEISQLDADIERAEATEARSVAAPPAAPPAPAETDEQRAAREEREAAEAKRVEDERARKAAEARNKNGTGDMTHVHVGAEERMYGKGLGRSYFADIVRAASGDWTAQDRLRRHGQEIEVEAKRDPKGTAARGLEAAARQFGENESRALNTTTGTGGAFVPPEYLEDQYIPLARELRPFVDTWSQKPLPKGTNVIYLPKVESGTDVAVQSTQNTAVNETDLTDAFISAPVQTVSGQQTLSLQLIDQSPVNFDEIVYADLQAAHAVKVDALAIAAVLAVENINATTYTSAAPKLTELYPYVAKALSDIRTNRHAVATHMWMVPDRWYWSLSQLDGNDRPLVVPRSNGTMNAMGNAIDGQPLYQSAGSLLIDTYLDANIPANLGSGTNQDVIIVAKMDDLYVYESAPVIRALPQTLGNQLSILLQLYSYECFLPQRYPTAVSTITGTGLVSPTF